MNRYRNAVGVRGPTKASPSTLCQKCLKRDIYECKATAQERPYLARPSRTQQLQNPKLRPQLTTEVPDHGVRTKGTADALVAQREEERRRKRELEEPKSLDNQGQAAKRSRSISSDSASSVSTLSTNRSRSRSLKRDRHEERTESRQSWSRKRRHSDASSGYSISSYSSKDKPRTRSPERNIRRRRRESSPKERGRPRDLSPDGGRRDRSRSYSMGKAPVARGRRSRTPRETVPGPNHRGPPSTTFNDHGGGENRGPPPRHERSLSPYSKRLALTQAMNLGR